MIKINLEDTYEPIEVAEDLSFMTYFSEITNSPKTLIKIEISPLGDLLLPNVYNMAFGPLNNGDIDDKAKINHQNKDKSFSTILLFLISANFFWLIFFYLYTHHLLFLMYSHYSLI